MANKRRKTTRISSADQLRVLASPVSIEIIQAIRTGGPASTAELGLRLGRNANSLHYHVRKLKQGGFLHEVGMRRSGARMQAVYDVTADVFRYENAPKDPRLRKYINNIVAAMLRLATRSFASSTERPESVREDGAYRNILADRYKARLTRSELAQVNKHLRAAREVFVSSKRTRRGELCTLTMILTPETDRSS